MYQELILQNDNLNLRPEKIKDGWLKHIKNEEENYLWVSNQRAFDLMKEGVLPPDTSSSNNNEFYEMIDAQLTTEIFGLYSPNYPDIALRMAYMPIRTVARENAAWISEFYIIMHSLASLETDHKTIKDKLFWMSEKARYILPNSSYSAKMYDYVKSKYESGLAWEITRDSLNYKYQINNEDGYNWSKLETKCNGCFAAGINFGASIISLFYGEGDFKETIKIASLCGWDSDNPASTWAGLLGFIYGKKEIVKMFDEELSTSYNIGRTRIGFENEIDNFESMAEKGLKIALIERNSQPYPHPRAIALNGYSLSIIKHLLDDQWENFEFTTAVEVGYVLSKDKMDEPFGKMQPPVIDGKVLDLDNYGFLN